jgi:hypothetical protein
MCEALVGRGGHRRSPGSSEKVVDGLLYKGDNRRLLDPMKFRNCLFAVAATVLLQACSTLEPVSNDQRVGAAAGSDLSWGRLRLQLPSQWEIKTREDGTGPIARSQVSDEEVRVTQYGARPKNANQTPAEHLQRYITELSPPDPGMPEVKDIVPYKPFAMPGHELATMRIQDLADDQFVVTYAIALPGGEMYEINFYRTGYSESAIRQYSEIVRGARIAPAGVTLNP